jgi:segregation and condensation protein B
MNPEIPRALEAIVLVADSPVESQLLAQLVELSVEEVEEVLRSVAATYVEQHRGFELVRVAGGWRFQTCNDLAPYVERFVLEGQSAKLSAAALETLAIIAYKQPISRAQIAAIRGVSVDGVVRTLEQRGYIGEVARDPGPGQAVLFGTTPEFLVKMGLDSLSQLPAIAEFVPGADVVEALEHGLRIEITDVPAFTDDESSGPESGPGETQADGRPSLGDLLDGDPGA